MIPVTAVKTNDYHKGWLAVASRPSLHLLAKAALMRAA